MEFFKLVILCSIMWAIRWFNSFSVSAPTTTQQSMDSMSSGKWMSSGKFQGDIAGFDDQDDFDRYLERVNRRWTARRSATASDNDPIVDSATSDAWRLWPGGIVPYRIHSDSSSPILRNAVEAAIRDFHANTCVRFVQRTDEASYVNIISIEDGCFSYIGRRNTSAAQNVNLGEDCWNKVDVLHELMHVLGFWHEHQRPDRDRHVQVHEQNIEPSCFKNNFKKAKFEQVTLLGPYDIHSVMHYSAMFHCSANGRPTITPRSVATISMGNMDGMTNEDISKIRKLYRCPSVEASTTPRSTTTATATRTTTTPSQSHCTRFTNENSICAVAYDQPGCNGHSYVIENKTYIDLSRDNWDDRIASLVMNRNSVMMLCRNKDFAGECDFVFAGETGNDVASLGGMERRASSLWCRYAGLTLINV